MLRYTEGDSFFHGLDPRTKLAFFISISVLAAVSTDIAYLFTLFVFTAVVFFANRLPLKETAGFSGFFIMISVFIVVFQGFFYPLGKSAVLAGGPVTWEGLEFGAAISLRMFSIFFSLCTLMLTTKYKSLMEALSGFMPADFAFSLSTSFRFIPTIEEETRKIMISQEARGLRKRGRRKLTAYFPVVVPLLSRSLERARNLAMSVEARGFGRSRIRYDLEMKRSDWLVIAGTVAFGVCLYVIYHA